MRKSIAFIILFIILLGIALAPPPQERTVRGTVYKADGVTQAQLATLVFINNTNTSIQVTTQTFGPPTQPGRYSAVILSVPDDLIYVLAYNATMWGERYGIMGTTQAVIDIRLNRTRDSEAKVVILYPGNDSAFDSEDIINVTANITILGNNGVNCNTTLDFSVDSIFYSSQTVNLGNMARGVPRLVKFNITSGMTGITNITVTAECSTDGINLQHLNTFTVYNISNSDITPPVITIFSPVNNSRKNNYITFSYNVSDNNPISNCTLDINSLTTNTSFFPNMTENFTYSLGQKYNNWTINCTDISGNMASRGKFNLTRNDRPYISSEIASPINLNAGSNKTVFCNGTVTDADSYTDIASVNSSLLFQGVTKNDQINRSSHYYNSSCTLFNGIGNSINYRCSFEVEYYALNGTWSCNSTALDYINASNTTEQDTDINELLAIGVSPGVIDFGNLQIMQISPSDIIVNVTNYGNVPLDLRLSAYSIFENDNLSMDCVKRNITLDYERWSLLSGQFFDSMISVNNSLTPSQVNINLRRKGYGDTSDSIDQVYWKLQIPFFVEGRCNGKILFGAVSG